MTRWKSSPDRSDAQSVVVAEGRSRREAHRVRHQRAVNLHASAQLNGGVRCVDRTENLPRPLQGNGLTPTDFQGEAKRRLVQLRHGRTAGQSESVVDEDLDRAGRFVDDELGVADDEEVDQLEKRIDETGMRILALFNPVATDLRAVVATMSAKATQRFG